jgi:hypothetical protein
MVSRKGKTTYSHLREDENNPLVLVETTNATAVEHMPILDTKPETTMATPTKTPSVSTDAEPRPVVVSVTTSIAGAASEPDECVKGVDEDGTKQFHYGDILVYSKRISLCVSTSMMKEEKEEEKECEEDNNDISCSCSSDVFETTREAAIEMMQNASSVVSRSFPSTGNTSDAVEEEKTDVIPVSGDATTTPTTTKSIEIQAQELRQKVVEQGYRCGNGLVETGRECVDTTQKAAHDLVEASASLGKGFMASTESCSKSAITETANLPLFSSPKLQETSKNFQSACGPTCEEVQEFITEHWALLKVHTTKVANYSKQKLFPQTNGSVGNVHSTDDDIVSNVSIEIQMKASPPLKEVKRL